jgi:hypothetical protein
MRTIDAVTPMPGIQYSFYFFTAIFISLLILIFLLRRQVQMVPKLYDPTDPQFNDKNKNHDLHCYRLSLAIHLSLYDSEPISGLVLWNFSPTKSPS